jgi:phage baseplate assembly protein W
MSSLAIRLPLVRENGDGFRTIKSFRSLIKQNFKMLLLTNPGERVMEPDYGVGIKKFLFENFDESTFSRVETNILEQVNIYMPVVSIQEITFQEIESSPNGLQIKIAYSIPDIAVQDLLEFTI